MGKRDARSRKMDEMARDGREGDCRRRECGRFIRDTMEGKPPQAIVGDADEAPVSIVSTGIPRAGHPVSNDGEADFPHQG
jgi:hypothetical protein